MPAYDTTLELVGFDGNKSVAQVAHVELVFCRRTFRGQFLLVDQLYSNPKLVVNARQRKQGFGGAAPEKIPFPLHKSDRIAIWHLGP